MAPPILLVQQGVRSFKVFDSWVAYVDGKGDLFLTKVDGTGDASVARDVIDYQFTPGALVFLTVNGSLHAQALTG
jgi:hypothetical protein